MNPSGLKSDFIISRGGFKLLTDLIDDLERQVDNIGEKNIKDYRICAVCLNYIKKSEYNKHLTKKHKYNIIKVVKI